MAKWGRVAIACVAVMCCLVQPLFAAPKMPENYESEFVLSLPEFATDICFLPNVDGKERYLVVLKRGEVRVVVDNEYLATPFMDISNMVNSHHDRGMTGCAVPDDFATSKLAFFIYTFENDATDYEGPKTSKVARVQADASGNRAVMSTFRVIVGKAGLDACHPRAPTLNVMCSETFTHANGGLAFDPSGHLLITQGDGGGNNPTFLATRAQKPENLQGKVIRVDINGNGIKGNATHPGNFFYKDGMSPQEPLAMVMALGFRNPWRVYHDPILNTPIVAEVGWSRFEEVDVVNNGANCAWPCREGEQLNVGYAGYDVCIEFNSGKPRAGYKRSPLVAYPHSEGAAASALIRLTAANSNFAPEDQGWIYYTDYVFNWCRRIKVAANRTITAGPEVWAEDLDGPVTFKTSPSKTLYYIALNAKEIRRIVYRPNPNPPAVELINPPDGATSAERTTQVRVTFSKRIRATSLTGGNFVLRATGAAVVTGQFTVDQSTNIASFKPDRRLEPNTSYTVTISGVVDTEGRVMQGQFLSQFTTGQAFSVFASDLPFQRALNGNGPVLRNTTIFDTPLRIRGEVYDVGLGTVPPFTVQFQAPALCRSFEGTVGVDDQVLQLDAGSVIANVTNGGQLRLSSSVARGMDGVAFSFPIQEQAPVVITGQFGPEKPRNRMTRVTSWGEMRMRCGPQSNGAQAPLVTGVQPGDGALNVGLNASLSIRFSQVMDPISLQSAVSVVQTGTDTPLSVTSSFTNGTTIMNVNLSELNFETTYRLGVSTSAKDSTGRRLQEGFFSEFSTRSLPPSGLNVPVSLLRPQVVSGEPGLSRERLTVGRLGTQPITKKYQNGLVIRAKNNVVYNFRDYPNTVNCTVFNTTLGIEANVDAYRANGTMEIEVDDTIVRAVKLTANMFEKRVVVPIAGARKLTLRAKIDGRSYDQELFAFGSPVLTCAGGPVALTSLRPSQLRDTEGYWRNLEYPGEFITTRIPPTAANSINFPNGYKMHATSKVRFNLPTQCSSVSAFVGVDVLSQNFGEMTFGVLKDDQTTATCVSPVLRGQQGVRKMTCPLEGASSFTLEAKSGPNSFGSKHDIGVWGNLTLDCAADALNPVCRIDPVQPTFRVGSMINFTGQGFNFNGAPLPDSTLTWQTLLVHCDPGCHVHEFDRLPGVGGGFIRVPDHGSSYYFEIQCTACSGGRCATTIVDVDALETVVTVTSDPPGLTVGVDSLTGTAPQQKKAVVGAAVSISTLQNQRGLVFSHWRHNANATAGTEVVVQSEDPRLFTAVFVNPQNSTTTRVASQGEDYELR